MPPSATDVLIRILGNSTGLNTELKKSSRDLDQFTNKVKDSSRQIGVFGNVVQGIFQGIGQALVGVVANGVRAAVGEIGKAITAASDLNESVSKTSVAFGDSAADILAWSKTASTSFGQSRQQALEAASSFGLLFASMGVGKGEAAEMSKSLVELASDIASINNLQPEEALEKLRSGLVGETEPLRTVGVLLNAAAVEAKAMELGLASSTKALTEQDKVMARYALILEQTQLTQGDFARTADGLANSQRTLAAQIADTSARFGEVLLPLQLAFTRGLSELIRIVEPYGLNIMRSFVGGLADGIVYLLPVLAELRAVFVRLLKPGSPPKLLPELTEWGKGALRAYMDGWSDVDSGALDALGGAIENILRSFQGAGRIGETDLVRRVFGSQRAIVDAINEWRQAGTISIGTLNNIRRAAGPAGESVSDLANSYFDLQRATQGQVAAQEALNAVNEKYNALLAPLNSKLDANAQAQQKIRDAQRLEELGDIIGDKTADIEDRQLARLEQEEIILRQQADALERERAVKEKDAQAGVDAAELERKAKEDAYNLQQAILTQQVEANRLLAEDIALRQKLADDALAKEEKARRDAEQAAAKEAAELERVADAHFRMQLATGDTARQLELWTAKLKAADDNTVEYYDALTQVYLLTKKLNEQLEAGGGGGGDGADETANQLEELGEKWPEIVKLEEAIDQFFKTLAGQQNEVGDLTWGQGILDFFTNAQRLAGEALPIVRDFINILMGKEIEGAEPGADPFAGNWWLEGIIPGLQGLILTLQQILDGDWAALWGRFKDYVDSVIAIDPNLDDGPYPWIRDVLIPALEALAQGEWADAWNSFTSAIQTGWQTAVDFIDGSIATITGAITTVITAIQDLFDLESRLQDFMERFGFPTNPFGPNLAPGQDVLPPSPYSSFPGVTPETLLPASLAGLGGNTTTTTNHLGPIQLVFNVPVTAEVARNAARTIDEELRTRGWSPA